MSTNSIAFLFFGFGYVVNMYYISILYHRGLTHKAVLMGPKLMAWLGLTGSWFTGLDPKTWACMHRLHHTHSDTKLDPHSPTTYGVLGVWVGQYKSYLNIQKGLLSKDTKFTDIVSDIPFDVNFIYKKNLSWLPYLVHGAVAIILSNIFNHFWVGGAYFLGMMSHPVQGWMVNALAHRYGKRNFETNDQSTNNTFVGLFVFGEGYQNNHHRFPERAKFSVKWNEIDMGYALCLISEGLGLLKINRAQKN
jgi:stearoyl-CoA desaturase (delta-9 desaturase)